VANKEIVEMLANVPLFSECSKKELQSIADATKEVTHRQGAVIAREGDTGMGFFLITEGTAKVTINGKARGTMGQGDAFGEISLLDEGPRSATVTAATPMKLLGLTAWNFRQLVSHNPSIAQKLLRVMADRLRSAATKELTH